ncbi:uncharacterized protein YbjT (DUF2867 family) [Asanoa ferruginea]|uniref:Uncharacterized protein YbjT (DUF2867 family) n=1 Tax=Asanoa ferruginea TaxID=53367 RepID=A0A3D9ZB46_9ACTN|nr:NmrA family NAD(P)-binding protein [Asanoa ferruginea]REF94636.1 uncharacterized protein YbjT (DUF2867 family) [Asanoa ferruginea]GIF53052.1 NmrA family transcriptional regulator [Asanoa ferruginea]
MIVVLGASGHVGSAVATALIEAGAPVRVVTRDARRGQPWRDRGADVAVVDVADTPALAAAFRGARRAFLLNPPAPVSTDTDAGERRTASSIVAALDGSGLEQVVAQSTYGAQPGDRIGDLSVLHEFEQAVARQPVPAHVVRGAYFMTNWVGVLTSARDDGLLPVMFPEDHVLPMVAPHDLGRIAADLLLTPETGNSLRHVEGPLRYTPREVATIMAEVLGRPVALRVVAREDWVAAFRSWGFSPEAAESYARMTAATVDGDPPTLVEVERQPTTLETFLAAARP